MSFRPLPVACARAREWVSLQLDAELSTLETALLDAHLARCAHCCAYARDVTALTERLRAEPLEQPAAVELPRRRRRARVRPARLASTVLAGAAAAAVAVAIGATSGSFSGQHGPFVVDATYKQLTLKEDRIDASFEASQRAAAHSGGVRGF
jgi:predicted anti-sigma-YlaC factor YlaD